MPLLTSQGKEALDAFINQAGQDPTIPPFVFGVTTAEGEVYFKGTGDKHFAKPSDGEVDADSVFWICSQSKLITHLAAIQLVEAGRLSPQSPVSEYLPEFGDCVVVEDSPPVVDLLARTDSANATEPKPITKFSPAKGVMKVEHLMHYTSGLFYPFDALPDWDKDLDGPYSMEHDPVDPVGAFVRAIKGDLPGIPLKFEPGTDWAYGWSSDILGFIVEKVTGTSLETYMQEHIFKPLGMTQTSFHQSPSMKDNLVSVAFRRENGLGPWEHRVYEADPEKVHMHCGGAAILSSARDYLAFLRHLLQIHDGTLDSKDAILSQKGLLELFTPSLTGKAQETIQAFLGPALPAPGVQWTNGQGVSTADWPGMRRKGTGFWEGYLNTSHWVDPTTGVAAVFQAQLIPPLDRCLAMVGAQLEMILYAGLEQ